MLFEFLRNFEKALSQFCCFALLTGRHHYSHGGMMVLPMADGFLAARMVASAVSLTWMKSLTWVVHVVWGVYLRIVFDEWIRLLILLLLAGA